ncbi:molybdopterin molybdotransferase MoeA [Amphibiibacter pelophylacis]|uniref:Molybdopterin molybdotransferase MoeA n=1 Tax=Amphibiibacter pelophylacis TaxID=1799477 RepID=A0ACC6P0I3_9BURK
MAEPLISVDDFIAQLPRWLTEPGWRARDGAAQSLPLDHLLSRHLAQDVIAPMAVPAFDNSAMDGYALAAPEGDNAQTARYTVTQRIAAGQTGQPLAPGEAARIFTGAPVPPGSTHIVMQEHAQVSDGVLVLDERPLYPGQHIRRRGEDLTQGQTVLRAQQALQAVDLALLASLGLSHASVRPRLRVALLTTGDELTEPGQPLAHGGVYSSTRHALRPLLTAWDAELVQVVHVRDNFDAMRQSLLDAAACADLVLSTGGVSVGGEDHVKDALEAVGALHSWRVAMKPGKPLALGRISTAQGAVPFIGLPGNPVSSLVTALLFVRPALALLGLPAAGLDRLAHRPGLQLWPQAVGGVLAQDVQGDLKRCEFLRLTPDADGRLRPLSRQGSGVLSSVAQASHLIRVDAGQTLAGSSVQPIWSLHELMTRPLDLSTQIAAGDASC